MSSKKHIRLWHIDALRGLAVIGMIVFHIFFILNFFDIRHAQLHEGWWLLLARFAQFTFIGLVGVSLTMSLKNYPVQMLRGLKIFGLGIIVSIATYIFDPETFVKFGILHFIGIGIILVAPLSRKKTINLFLGITAFIIGKIINQIPATNIFLYILGFQVPNFTALDYFPLFPWISTIFGGMFVGNILKEKLKIANIAMPKILMPITFLGKHSLLIYMIHVPIIIMTLWIFGKISL